MARTEPSVNWRIEAVAPDDQTGLSEAALRGFNEAGDHLGRPGAFEDCAVVVESQVFAEMTGFHPQAGELIAKGVVKRAAEAATAGRTKALANCRGAWGADYVGLGVFLRVCATHGLSLRVSRHLTRRRST